MKERFPASKRNAKPWRLDVQDAERPGDTDAFLRRLAEVLLSLDRDAKTAVEVDPPND